MRIDDVCDFNKEYYKEGAFDIGLCSECKCDSQCLYKESVVIDKPAKLAEHTYGSHIFMRMKFPEGNVEAIDVYLNHNGEMSYATSEDDDGKMRRKIIQAFNDLY